MGRFESFIGAALFAVAFAAAMIVIVYWCAVLFRSSRALRRAGASPRADLLQGIMRRTLLWVAGTIAFTAVFWLAICHDMTTFGAHRFTLPGPSLNP
jgi:hypothetical protein